jgi:tRNA(Arg) A34 adenosine deaminase TadA
MAEELAWISGLGKNFFSQSTTLPLGTAVSELVQGVFDHDPKNARLILRSRIFTTQKSDEFSQGMIKVAAKRVEWEAPRTSLDGFTLLKPLPKPLADDSQLIGHRVACKEEGISYANRLANKIHREGPRYTLSRNVGALLVDFAGEILATALNTNSQNRTHHAELNLLKNYFEKNGISRLRPGSRIYVSLKCCKMCAGAIWEASEDPATIQVFYGEDDQGWGARSTVLDEGSNERRRAAGFLGRPELVKMRIARNVPIEGCHPTP